MIIEKNRVYKYSHFINDLEKKLNNTRNTCMQGMYELLSSFFLFTTHISEFGTELQLCSNKINVCICLLTHISKDIFDLFLNEY